MNSSVGHKPNPSLAMDYTWIRSLETFLGAKLRHPKGSILPHIGPIIDGVVLSLDDHPNKINESVQAITSFLRGCRDPTSRYNAWCLIDAVLKQSTISPLQESLAKIVPNLMEQEMPLGHPPQASQPGEVEMTMAYLELTRSWVEQQVFPQQLIAQVESHLSFALSRVSSSANNARGDASAQRMTEVVKSLQQQRKQMEAAHTSKDVNKGNGTSVADSAPAATGKVVVAKFVAAAYDQSRAKLLCVRCGAPFATEEARGNHQRSHYDTKVTTASVRLHYPNATAFQSHEPTHAESGATVKLVLPVSQAERQQFLPKMSRKRGRDGDSGNSPGVPVIDLGKVYSCSVCHQKIDPSLHDTNDAQQWILKDCVTTENEQIAHRRCT